MRTTSKLLALALSAALQPAFASVTTISIDFENIAGSVNKSGVLDLTTKSLVDGVAFTGASWGAASYTACPRPNSYGFGFDVNSGGCRAFLLAGSDLSNPNGKQTATINITGGFIAGSSLYYSALSTSRVSITAYENLSNITGKKLSFVVNSDGGCDDGLLFCTWTRLDMNFGFTATSLVISGMDQQVLLDDITFVAPASTRPPAGVPEPGSMALALGALGALAWGRKRSSATS